jgi:NADH dehydrogenase/NADH:ubiquinone oxidoreductase subunit G
VKTTVTIDGRAVAVEQGTFLLAAARRAGIDIPALCHHDALAPYGSCRLCLVEVTRGDRTRLTTSCNYPVRREGESVSTRSANVLRARRVVMELLLARCPDSAPVRAMAVSLGISASRFPAPRPSRLAAGDEALVDCILCGLCVRACDEAIGASAISFAERGPNRRVATPFLASAAACTGCGACAAVCPTRVITIEDTPAGTRRIAFLRTEVPLRRCASCGRPFGPEPQLTRLAADAGRRVRPGSPAAQAAGPPDTCPACRRSTFGARMARWTALLPAADRGEPRP